MHDTPGAFNLLVEKWIPVLRANGRPARVSIRDALTEAGGIRQIAASNPMDNVALLRFLLAVLYWCKGDPPGDGENDQILAAGRFPADWFAKLDQQKDCFNLLGEGDRFYQDKRVLNDGKHRPIGDLLVEFPTETKIAHFRHVRDDNYGFCLACCALGIVRFCAFANAYAGARYTSAVNGPTPAYVVGEGEVLLQTLWHNLTKSTKLNRDPPWLCNTAPSFQELDLPTVLAWRSRRLWLGDRESGAAPCAYCGESTRLIKGMAFSGGWKSPFQIKGKEKKFWDQDPHLVFELRKKEGDDDLDENPEEAPGARTQSVQRTTIGFPRPGDRVAAHARFWRRALAAWVLRSDSTGKMGPLKSITVAGPAASKSGGLYQDAASLSLSPPPANAAVDLANVLTTLTDATQRLFGVLGRSTPNPQQQHPNRKAALDALSPSMEARLREDVYRAVDTNACTPDEKSSAMELWRKDLSARLGLVVETVVAASTPGSPLRRAEAAQEAGRALDQMMKRLTDTDKNGPSPDSEAKPKRPRRKRGGT